MDKESQRFAEMAKEQTDTGTTNTVKGSVVECKIETTRRVRYIFKTGEWVNPSVSEKNLSSIPFALAIDGKIQPEYKNHHRIVNAGQYIEVWVEPGKKVHLYLNSDAWVQYRQEPVFEITPKERHVDVIIHERRGKLGDLNTPKFVATREVKGKSGGDACVTKVDEYESILSGDTWLRVSHKYTSGEADTLMPADTPQRIKDAVKAIYGGKVGTSFTVPDDKGKPSVEVSVEAASNPQENVSGFNNSTDGLPRVHPNAWVALIEAAESAGVKKVVTSSAWRPLLGSVLHRSGLALDVQYLDGVRMNRATLDPDNKGGPKAGTNVSDSEAEVFRKYMEAEKEAKAAQEELENARTAAKVAAKVAEKPGGTPEEIQARKDALKKAQEKAAQAQIKRDTKVQANEDAEKAWAKKLEDDEPKSMKSYRASLLKCKCVQQVFDPWYIDTNAHDNKPPKPNTLRSGIEDLHKHHLHITVFDKVSAK